MLEWHIVVVSIVQAHYERFQGCRFIHPNIWPSTQGDGDRVNDLTFFPLEYKVEIFKQCLDLIWASSPYRIRWLGAIRNFVVDWARAHSNCCNGDL